MVSEGFVFCSQIFFEQKEISSLFQMHFKLLGSSAGSGRDTKGNDSHIPLDNRYNSIDPALEHLIGYV